MIFSYWEHARMTHKQRIALVAMLTGMAFVLHSLFFEWATDWGPPGANGLFSSLMCDSIDSGCLRIWYDSSAGYISSFLYTLLGIVLPLVMLCGAGYLWLGAGASPSKE